MVPPPGIGSDEYPEGMFGLCGGFVGGVYLGDGLGGCLGGGHGTVGDLGGFLRNSFQISRSKRASAPTCHRSFIKTC